MKLGTKTRIYLMALSVALILLSTFVSVTSFSNIYHQEEISDNHWLVTINGKYLGQSSSEDIMSDFGIILRKGDVMTMSTTMPDLGEIAFPTLFLQS